MVQGMRDLRAWTGITAPFGCRLATSRISLVRIASLNFARSLIGIDERAGPADHAVLEIDVEVVDIHRRVGCRLHHDRQAVDDDALGERGIACDQHRLAVVVRSVAGNVDHAPEALVRVVREQLHAEIDRARNRGARGAPQRRLHDFGGDRVGGLRPVDDPPGNDHLLVVRGRPLEVGDCDLAVRAALQRLQKVGRDHRLRVAFALDRQAHRGPSNRRHRRRGSARHRPRRRRLSARSGGRSARRRRQRRRRQASTAASAAPIETHQRIPALPSLSAMLPRRA